jgi:hypothetical protein
MRTLVLGLLSILAGCGAGNDPCTEIGCDHLAVVTFPAGFVDGPYDLVLRRDAQTSAARCADPSAPETADNPAGLTCDLLGFTLEGHSLDNARSVFVTVIRVADDETLVDDVEVRLDAVGEERPNGPDCDPICFIRNGQLALPGR